MMSSSYTYAAKHSRWTDAWYHGAQAELPIETETSTRRARAVYDKRQSRLLGKAFERGKIRLVGVHLHLRFRMVDEVENVFA